MTEGVRDTMPPTETTAFCQLTVISIYKPSYFTPKPIIRPSDFVASTARHMLKVDRKLNQQ